MDRVVKFKIENILFFLGSVEICSFFLCDGGQFDIFIVLDIELQFV